MNIDPKVINQEESIIEYSQRYRTLKAFKKACNAVFDEAVSLGITLYCCKGSVKPALDKIIEPINKNARRYSTINEWASSDPEFFLSALKLDKLTVCTEHMSTPVKRYTKPVLMNSTKRHESFTQWSKSERAAFLYATNAGLIDDVRGLFLDPDKPYSDDFIFNTLYDSTNLATWKSQYPEHYLAAESSDILGEVQQVIELNNQRNEVISTTEGVTTFFDWVTQHIEAFQIANEINMLDVCNQRVLFNQQMQEEENKKSSTQKSKKKPPRKIITSETHFAHRSSRTYGSFRDERRTHTSEELIDTALKYPNLDEWERGDYVTYHKAKIRKLLPKCEQAQQNALANS